ncbi:MAG: imidazole glycerol phosphate synthase subunit HisH [Rubrivivax sp.]|jgi:glutamine amidotransferase
MITKTQSRKVSIVDYGVGNVGALINMFDYLGADAYAVTDAQGILDSERLVLPGIGAFDKAMSNLADRYLLEPLNKAVKEMHIPVLGVCLGMQLLARSSEEGERPGLGWIAADVKRIKLPPNSSLKVPHIGWTDVFPAGDHQLFASPDHAQEPDRFYFDHSYYMACDNANEIAGTIDYEGSLCCAVRRNNITGMQFHPEKSHRFGMRVLNAWLDTAATAIQV